jgi:hypothetical protein
VFFDKATIEYALYPARKNVYMELVQEEFEAKLQSMEDQC